MQERLQDAEGATSPSEQSLRLYLLGTFALWVQGREVEKLSRSGKWLLALLVLKRSRPLSRDWLAETLWPEATQERSTFYLRRTLMELRVALGPEGQHLVSPTRATIHFDFHEAFCDVIAFDRLVDSKEESSLEAAVSHYQGAFLEECTHAWVLPERTHRTERYIAALETLAERREQRGELCEARQMLQRAVNTDPLRETTQRQLIRLLGQEGNYIGVERQYRKLRRVLRDELNIEPAEETVRLYRHLMTQDRQPAAHSAPNRRSPTVGPKHFATLPHPLTSLIGREREQAEISGYLKTRRLVTLTGTGGVGKTRLALTVAETQQAEFAHGVVWVELATVSSESQLVQAIQVALQLSERPGETRLQTVTNYLRTMPLLLVLDNCEHLLDASAFLAHHLLNACAEVKILATSRQAFGLFGETVWRVASLTVPGEAEAQNPMQAVGETGAGRLFMARAQAVRQTFRLTAENAPAIARICRKLDGIPLALELAAAWVRTLSAEEIARRLDDQFTLLQHGERTAALRHQTLRNAMDWSYSLLNPDEQRFLRRLSVFVGGWTLDAAEAIGTENGTERAQALLQLGSLAEKSLVETEERNHALGYRLLEPVRQYALQRLHEAGEERVIQQRHFLFCVEAAERLSELLDGPRLCEGLARMDADYANFRAALQFGLVVLPETKGGRQTLRLAIALNRYGVVSGRYQENWEAMEDALRRFPAHEDTTLRAEALQTVSVTVFRIGDMHAVHRYAGEAENLYKDLAPCAGLLVALRMQGTAALTTQNYRLARNFLERGLAISQAIGDRNHRARMELSLGVLTRLEGNLPQAQTLLEAATRHFEASGLLMDAGVAHHNLANVLKEREDWIGAKRHLLRSLAIHRQIENRPWIGINLSILAFLLEEESPAEARKMAEESLTYCQPGSVSVAHCLQLLSRIAGRQGDFLQSRAYIEEAIHLQLCMNVKRDLSYALMDACSLLILEGFPARAVQLLTAIVTFRETILSPLTPEDQPGLDKRFAACRDAIGNEAFAAAEQRGRTMTLEDAVAVALDSP